MFGIRTPPNNKKTTQKEDEDLIKINVRRLTGEFEASAGKKSPNISPQPATSVTVSRKNKAMLLQKQILNQIAATRNTKTEIKNEIRIGVQGLLSIILEADETIKTYRKEIENLRSSVNQKEVCDTKRKEEDLIIEIKKTLEKQTKILSEIKIEQEIEKERHKSKPNIEARDGKEEAQIQEIKNLVEENNKILNKNSNKLEEINNKTEKKEEEPKNRSYASVAARPGGKIPLQRTALHSIVITSKDEMDTGQQVLEIVREVVKAREEGIKIENIRKAKNSKIIIGCRTEEGRNAVKDRLRKTEKLNVEDAVNKKPLVVLKNVLEDNSDEDIRTALRTQNEHIFEGLNEEQKVCEILFRKKTRNPQVSHVVMRVTPLLWRRLTEHGHAHIDLQKVRVEDQSPVIQCSMCLGYGHSKRLCTEKQLRCSHCGGPHVKAKCEAWLSNAAPKCCNCTHAKLEETQHNAFSDECPIRRKWDTLVRATIAYT